MKKHYIKPTMKLTRTCCVSLLAGSDGVNVSSGDYDADINGPSLSKEITIGGDGDTEDEY